MPTPPPVLLAFTLALALCACAASPPAAGSAPAPAPGAPVTTPHPPPRAATVMVDAAAVLNTGTSGGARLGINTNAWWDDDANRPSGSPRLADALARTGLRHWRYPGGEKADGFLWSVPPFDRPAPRLARVSPRDWPSNDPEYWRPAGDPQGTWSHPILDYDEFMTACRAASCEPVLVVAYDGIHKPAEPGGINVSRGLALATAAAWVRYANVTRGHGVKYWEVGNETYKTDPGTSCTYMGCDPGRARQARDVVAFSAAMKAVDPTIEIGVNTEEEEDWKVLLAGAGAAIDFLSVHTYPAWPYAAYDDYLRDDLDPSLNVDRAWRALQGFGALRDRLRIVVTETGPLTFGVRGAWTDNDLGHALMTVDLLGKLSQDARVTFSQVWSTRFVRGPRNHAENDVLREDNTPSATGLGLELLSRHLLDVMVRTGSSDRALVTFASRTPDGSRTNVVLVNKRREAARVTVHAGSAATWDAADVLSGTGPEDTQPTLSSLAPVGAEPGAVTIDVPGTSVVVVRLTADERVGPLGSGARRLLR